MLVFCTGVKLRPCCDALELPTTRQGCLLRARVKVCFLMSNLRARPTAAARRGKFAACGRSRSARRICVTDSDLERLLYSAAGCTTTPATVEFQSGPVARPGDRWPAAIGRRRLSSAQSERPQPISPAIGRQRVNSRSRSKAGTPSTSRLPLAPSSRNSSCMIENLSRAFVPLPRHPKLV